MKMGHKVTYLTKKHKTYNHQLLQFWNNIIALTEPKAKLVRTVNYSIYWQMSSCAMRGDQRLLTIQKFRRKLYLGMKSTKHLKPTFSKSIPEFARTLGDPRFL